MAVSSISIEVGADAAQAFVAAPSEQQRKIQFLLGLRLRELIAASPRPLAQIMDEIGAHAQAQGMTPELLSSLLGVK
jgi:hypothetical protein